MLHNYFAGFFRFLIISRVRPYFPKTFVTLSAGEMLEN